MANNVSFVDAERIHDRHDVVAGYILTVASWIFRHVRRRIAARRKCNAAMRTREIPHLRFPRAMVAGEFVDKDDRSAGTGLFAMELGAVGCGDLRHRYLAIDCYAASAKSSSSQISVTGAGRTSPVRP